MKKVFAVGIVLVLMGSLAFSPAMAFSLESQVPELSVTADGIILPSTMGLNIWNGAMVDRADTLESLAKGTEELPYVPLGTPIHFTFDGDAPDRMALTGYVLNEDGTQKYWVDVPQDELPFTFEDGEGSFPLPGNFLTMLSSDSRDYEAGQSIQGFKLTCAWGENECEYAFMLRTDAGIWEDPAQGVGKISSDTPVRITGAILDATMNTIKIRAEDGRTLAFSTVDADKTKCKGLILGSSVDVFYTGEIIDEDTSGAVVTALVQ